MHDKPVTILQYDFWDYVTSIFTTVSLYSVFISIFTHTVQSEILQQSQVHSMWDRWHSLCYGNVENNHTCIKKTEMHLSVHSECGRRFVEIDRRDAGYTSCLHYVGAMRANRQTHQVTSHVELFMKRWATRSIRRPRTLLSDADHKNQLTKHTLKGDRQADIIVS